MEVRLLGAVGPKGKQPQQTEVMPKIVWCLNREQVWKVQAAGIVDQVKKPIER